MNTQKYIQIERYDGSFVDVTKDVTECRIDIGDVTGVGEQGNDGACPILTLTLNNSKEYTYNPSITKGKKIYTQEIINGNNSATYTPNNINIFPNSCTIYETITGSEIWCNITVNDDDTITFGQAIPTGTAIRIQYTYFDVDYENPINYYLGVEDKLIQSNRAIEVAIKKGEVTLITETINGNGSDTYGIGQAGIIPTSAYIKTQNIKKTWVDYTAFKWIDKPVENWIENSVETSVYFPKRWTDYSSYKWNVKPLEKWNENPEQDDLFFSIIEVDYENNQFVFQNAVPENVVLQVYYSINTGIIRTIFRGLIGDKISESYDKVRLQCRDEKTKILQKTPIIYNEDPTKSKVREYSAIYTNQFGYWQGYKLYDVTISGDIVFKANGLFTLLFKAQQFIIIGTYLVQIVSIANNNEMTVTTIADGTHALYYTYNNGIPLRDFLQFTVSDMLGRNAFAIYEPVNLGRRVLVKPEYFEYKSLWQFCQAQVNATGQFFGSRYYSESEPFRMTIYKVDRELEVPNKILSYKRDFYKVELDSSDNSYRDGVIVYYNNSTTGIKETVTAPSGMSVLDMYEPMILDENETYMIDNAVDAQTFANNVYSDVQNIPQQSQLIMPLEPTLELFDLCQITYPYLYTGNQNFAIDSMSMDILEAKTTATASNKIKGGIKKWTNKEARPGKYQPTTASRITTLGTLPPPTGLTNSTETVENYGQIVGVTTEISWTKPFGYTPISYWVEMKKSTDDWTNSSSFTVDGTLSSRKFNVEENTSYNVRIASKNKEQSLGNYVTYDFSIGSISAISREYYIRTQEQFDDWFQSLGNERDSATIPAYEKLIIIPLEANGTYTITLTEEKYIQASTFEIVATNAKLKIDTALGINIYANSFTLNAENATIIHATNTSNSKLLYAESYRVSIQGGKYDVEGTGTSKLLSFVTPSFEVGAAAKTWDDFPLLTYNDVAGATWESQSGYTSSIVIRNVNLKNGDIYISKPNIWSIYDSTTFDDLTGETWLSLDNYSENVNITQSSFENCEINFSKCQGISMSNNTQIKNCEILTGNTERFAFNNNQITYDTDDMPTNIIHSTGTITASSFNQNTITTNLETDPGAVKYLVSADTSIDYSTIQGNSIYTKVGGSPTSIFAGYGDNKAVTTIESNNTKN